MDVIKKQSVHFRIGFVVGKRIAESWVIQFVKNFVRLQVQAPFARAALERKIRLLGEDLPAAPFFRVRKRPVALEEDDFAGTFLAHEGLETLPGVIISPAHVDDELVNDGKQ